MAKNTLEWPKIPETRKLRFAQNLCGARKEAAHSKHTNKLWQTTVVGLFFTPPLPLRKLRITRGAQSSPSKGFLRARDSSAILVC